jgi:hypothetical protein
MFCPVCKSEYRPGFTECSDCGVPLVETLDETSAATDNAPEPKTAVLLWSGTSVEAEGAINRALEEAKIPHHSISHGAVYAIFVHERDRDAARAALEDAKQRLLTQPTDDDDSILPENVESIAVDGDEPEDLEAPLQLTNYVPDTFNPDDATVEVWSGADRGMADGLAMCLRENGIGSAISKESAAARLRVVPSDATRAREIVAEVVKARSDD